MKGAFEAMMAGKLNVTVECNPQLGPQLMTVVGKCSQARNSQKWVKTKEGVFPMETAAEVPEPQVLSISRPDRRR